MAKLWTRVLFLASTLTLSTAALVTSSVAPAHDDSFTVYTTDGCGAVDFADLGPGVPGGGDNDDYTVIHDYCGDGYGVKAWAWLDSTAAGEQYHGNGLAGGPIMWDPFLSSGTVLAGDWISLKVCLVNDNADSAPTKCAAHTQTSHDG